MLNIIVAKSKYALLKYRKETKLYWHLYLEQLGSSDF